MTENQRERQIYRVTIAGSIVSLLLILVKFPAGIAGRSAAMIADAVHSLSDFITDVVVIVFVKTAQKPKDKEHACGVAVDVLMVTVVLLPAVAVVPSEIPATELVLFNVMTLPLAMFAVVTVKVTVPAVPVLSVPTCQAKHTPVFTIV